jgi:transposase
MKKKWFIGIDVSKHTLDASFLMQQGTKRSEASWQVFANTDAGLAKFKKWLTANGVPFSANTLLVIENTGVYHRLLVNFCAQQQLPICVENGAQVKWSLGIGRGKNDRIDSHRLLAYACRFADRLKPTAALLPGIQAIKDLTAMRSRQLTHLASLKAHLKELAATTNPADVKALEKIHKPIIKASEVAIKKMEATIVQKINENANTKQQYKLLLSIPGIGPVTAAYLIACTNAFTNCSSGKQLACYCGVVPFDHQSGISVKGKHRVHHMANKTLKSLLHMCALTTIKYSPEFKAYVERRTANGKHMMSTINAVRNRLVLRAYAVVRDNKPYVENLCKSAA